MRLSASIFKRRMEEMLQSGIGAAGPPRHEWQQPDPAAAVRTGEAHSDPPGTSQETVEDLQRKLLELRFKVDQALSRLAAGSPASTALSPDALPGGEESHRALDHLVQRQEALKKALVSRISELQELCLRVFYRLDALGVETIREYNASSQELKDALAGLADKQDIATLSAKLDSYVRDIAARQDGMQAGLEALRSALPNDFANLAGRIRSPIINAGDNILAMEIDGFILGIPREEWRLSAYYAFRGLLEPGLMRAYQAALRPGMHVVDAGANIGIHTLYGARLVGAAGKVFSFEPTPRTFAILRDNVQVNGLLETGVVVLYQLALSDRAGAASFAVYARDCGHNTLFPDGRACETIAVQTAALDEVLPPGTRVDIVKIDAEGAEPLILRGMKRVLQENPEMILFVEFAPTHLNRGPVPPADFLNEIAGMGFRVQVVHDLTGEFLDKPREELLAADSVNLRLTRQV